MNIYPTVFRVLRPFTESVTVERRTETIGEDGLVTIGMDAWYDVKMIVVPVAPNTLDRTAEYDTTADTIEVTTQFPLQSPTKGYKSDVVIYGNTRYLVTGNLDYSKGGKGFVTAICQATDNLSQPPLEE